MVQSHSEGGLRHSRQKEEREMVKRADKKGEGRENRNSCG